MKMRTMIRGSMLLAGAGLFASIGIWAQVTPSGLKHSTVSADLGVTFSLERAQIVPGRCCFWLQGGGMDAAVTLGKGFGVAASVTGDHTTDALPGVDVNKITALVGPRYTFTAWTGRSQPADERRLQIFGQALFGGVHGFNGLYPTPGGATTNARSFALEAGGGLNLYFSKHVGLRIPEVEYVRTALPNNGSNTQHDLRIAFGMTFHF
jgi:hypothetical protein